MTTTASQDPAQLSGSPRTEELIDLYPRTSPECACASLGTRRTSIGSRRQPVLHLIPQGTFAGSEGTPLKRPPTSSPVWLAVLPHVPLSMSSSMSSSMSKATSTIMSCSTGSGAEST